MSPQRAFEPIVDVLTGMAARIRAASSRRRTERLIARFPPCRLEDIGFERDWDGSIHPTSDHR